MRWALVALLLLAPTGMATQSFVAPPVGNPAPFAPQMTCTVVLAGSTFEDCRFDGVVAFASHARIVIQGAASTVFRLDDDTTHRQGGQGSCASPQCVIPLNYVVSGNAFVTFKVSGTPGASATIVIDREKL